MSNFCRWFRFILDGKLATMYSSGSPEGGTDSSGYILNLVYNYIFIKFTFAKSC